MSAFTSTNVASSLLGASPATVLPHALARFAAHNSKAKPTSSSAQINVKNKHVRKLLQIVLTAAKTLAPLTTSLANTAAWSAR